MGSIQLFSDDKLQTRVHSNFPDKIRSQFSFLTGVSLSDYVMKHQSFFYVKEYKNQKIFNQKTKIDVDCYLCLPLIAHHQFIGVLNIAKKETSYDAISFEEDIHILLSILSIASALIYNSILYQDILKKQKLDQELIILHFIILLFQKEFLIN